MATGQTQAAALSAFPSNYLLAALNAVPGGGGKIEKQVFPNDRTEARHDFILDARKQIDALQNGKTKSTWVKQQESDGRIQITFKCGSHVLELIKGRTYYIAEDVQMACELIAKAAVAAEEGLLDEHIIPKRKAKEGKSKGVIAAVKKSLATTRNGEDAMHAAEPAQVDMDTEADHA
jgi:hypothetical protein